MFHNCCSQGDHGGRGELLARVAGWLHGRPLVLAKTKSCMRYATEHIERNCSLKEVFVQGYRVKLVHASLDVLKYMNSATYRIILLAVDVCVC